MKPLHLTVILVFFILASCAIPEPPKQAALVYGISIYGNSNNAPNLVVADDDAIAVRNLLNSQGFIVTTKINDAATKSAMLQDIKNLKGFQGQVIFYYSGHGFLDSNNTAYICPKDIWNDTDQNYEFSNLISASELFNTFQQADLKNVIVLLDSCFSGGFVNEGGTIDAVPPIFGPNEQPEGSIKYSFILQALAPAYSAYCNYASYGSIIVISSGGSQEPVYESDGHGIFTYYFLQTPQYGDIDRDGVISTTEIYYYTAESIQRTWNKYYQDYYDIYTEQYADFHPHITGSPREYILFKR
jgi:hypothetical protein